MEKKFIMTCMFIGSIAGSYVPVLWGSSFFSFTSILLGGVGGILGIWIGYKISQEI